MLDEFTSLTTTPVSKPTTTTKAPTTTSKPSRTTTKKPTANFQCGVKPILTTSRIVGGNQAAANSWPWQVNNIKKLPGFVFLL